MQKGEPPNSRIKLAYPTMTVLGRDMPLAPFFFGADLWTANDTLIPVEKRPSELKYLTMILLQFRMEKPANITEQLLKQFELGMVDYLTRSDFSTTKNQSFTLLYCLANTRAILFDRWD